MQRSFRYGTLVALFNIVIAPFGNVKFKTYLLAEILTDCSIAFTDLSKIALYLHEDNWNGHALKLSDSQFDRAPTIKWIFYCLTFLPYMWRMNQNLRKWLVYNHRLQAFNALKYFILFSAQICGIIYYEANLKAFKYVYYGLKVIGYAYKYFWDLYYDWGLFHGTTPKRRLLRDKIKYAPCFYYFSMVYNLFGLYSWAFILLLSSLVQPKVDDPSQGYPIEYYNNLMWLSWLEFMIVAIRRTIWVVIRVESEFYNNYEQYRDIVTIPPIKFED